MNRTIAKIGYNIRWGWQKFLMRYLRYGYLSYFSDTLIIEPTNQCSLQCTCCPNGHPDIAMRPKGHMSWDTFESIWKHIDIPISSVCLYFHGEPLLNPELPRMVAWLTKRHIHVSIFSNAYGINIRRLDECLQSASDTSLIRLAFSAELHDAALYESVRKPARYETILQTLDEINCVFERHHVFFTVNAIMRPRAKQQEKEYRLQENKAVFDLMERYSQLEAVHFSSRFPWPGLPDTGDLEGNINPTYNICDQALANPSVCWDGRVTMCSSDYSGQCIIGSLLDTPYSKLINNRAARRFRRELFMRERNKNPFCQTCLLPRTSIRQRVVKRSHKHE